MNSVRDMDGVCALTDRIERKIEELFQNDLYYQLGAHADRLARKIQKAF